MTKLCDKIFALETFAVENNFALKSLKLRWGILYFLTTGRVRQRKAQRKHKRKLPPCHLLHPNVVTQCTKSARTMSLHIPAVTSDLYTCSKSQRKTVFGSSESTKQLSMTPSKSMETLSSRYAIHISLLTRI